MQHPLSCLTTSCTCLKKLNPNKGDMTHVKKTPPLEPPSLQTFPKTFLRPSLTAQGAVNCKCMDKQQMLLFNSYTRHSKNIVIVLEI